MESAIASDRPTRAVQPGPGSFVAVFERLSAARAAGRDTELAVTGARIFSNNSALPQLSKPEASCSSELSPKAPMTRNSVSSVGLSRPHSKLLTVFLLHLARVARSF